MTADTLFAIANPLALAGWIVLALGVILRKPFLRDTLAGKCWPLGFSVLYTVLILFFFWSAPGGFDTLANVQLLFTSKWAALAGWVHYLAFDLLVGSIIARQLMEQGLPRLILVPLLPLTFLLGPIGFLAWHLIRLGFGRPATTSA